MAFEVAMWAGGFLIVALFALTGFIATSVLNSIKENAIRDNLRHDLIHVNQIAVLDKISQTNENIAKLGTTLTHVIELELPAMKTRLIRLEDRAINH